jgi:hypothetical protein
MLSIKNITSKHYFFKQKKINIISMRKSQWLFLIGIIVLLASCSKATIEPQTFVVEQWLVECIGDKKTIVYA